MVSGLRYNYEQQHSDAYRETSNWFVEYDGRLRFPAAFWRIAVWRRATHELPHSDLATCGTTSKDALQRFNISQRTNFMLPLDH